MPLFVSPRRTVFSVISRPCSPLFLASRFRLRSWTRSAFIDALMKQWEAEYRRTGNPLFTLKGDDIELALDEKSGTRKRFGDSSLLIREDRER